jgi:hypothetical protein
MQAWRLFTSPTIQNDYCQDIFYETSGLNIILNAFLSSIIFFLYMDLYKWPSSN